MNTRKLTPNMANYSRPFERRFHHLLSGEALALALFENALFEIGMSFLGDDASNACCDIRNSPGAHYSVNGKVLAEIRDFAENKERFERYKKSLPPMSAFAVSGIVYYVQSTPHSLALVGDTQIKELLDELAQQFETLWIHEHLLDPRLALAEKIYYYGAYRDTLPPECALNNDERYIASLEWMKRPDIALRVAKMLLSSRLAPHYGELNSRAFGIAELIADDMNKAGPDQVVATLQNCPQEYLARARAKRLAAKRMPKLAIDIAVAWECATGRRRISHTRELSLLAEYIADDYLRVKNGRWAQEQITLMREQPVAQPPAGPRPPAAPPHPEV